MICHLPGHGKGHQSLPTPEGSGARKATDEAMEEIKVFH